ncbi:Major facilitator superfamily domain general substrate transporter [Penicillium frequentans]|nr:Major facilitator superfamily domain general substrate transporter [Penicillium glabrum]
MKSRKDLGLSGTAAPFPSAPMSMPDLTTVAVDQTTVAGNGTLKTQENPTTAYMEANVDVASSLMPQNWSNRRKWLILIILSLMSLMVNMSLVICTPASSVIAQQFNNYDSFLLVFFITVPNLGEVVAPLYIGPLSERFGRVPICHLFNHMFLVFTMVTGFSKSLAMVIVFRCLAGASVASICLNPAITGDLFAVKKRGAAMSLTSMVPILGSAVGPIIGGYVTQYLSWRWTFWLMSIATACLALLMVAVLKESYVPLIRRRALQKSGSGQGNVNSPSKYLIGWNLTTFKSIALFTIRPFVILSSSRIAVLMALYLSILFGYVSLLVATTASVFQDVYGFSESQSGLIYIALTIGTLSGALMCTFTLDYFLLRGLSRKTPDDCTTPCPENRLLPIIPAMVIFPVGLLLYGWSPFSLSLDRSDHRYRSMRLFTVE